MVTASTRPTVPCVLKISKILSISGASNTAHNAVAIGTVEKGTVRIGDTISITDGLGPTFEDEVVSLQTHGRPLQEASDDTEVGIGLATLRPRDLWRAFPALKPELKSAAKSEGLPPPPPSA